MIAEDPHRIVSSEAEELILVDRDDNVTGFLSKADCHDGAGRLHRAFSVFLFNADGELLLQQRAEGKRLWPGYWSNTCCSHPRRGETLEVASGRRLQDELNVAAELEFAYRFVYQAPFGDAGSEHELCHVFLGRVTEPPWPNQSEIASLRYLSAADLDVELLASPERFTPWFKLEWDALKLGHAERLAAFTQAAKPAQ
ncbi:MAG: isopentenyl-diphosphate Delta-isomerase [Pseudomonadota bacterium]